MNKFEAKVKESLKTAAEQTPDYWEAISKKTNIPYNGRIIMKKSRERNIFRLRYLVPATCGLALVAMLAFINFPGNNTPNLGGDITSTQTVENLNINNILSSTSAKIRLPENGTTEELSYDAYLEKTGMGLDLWLPTGLDTKENGFVYYNEDGTEFMMSGFAFRNPSTGANIRIRFQQGNLPITDVRYQLEKEAVSTINGEDIVIGFNKELGEYVTTFMYQDMGYELSGGQGVSQEEFIQVIQSILQ